MSHLFGNYLRLYGRKSQKDFSASCWLRPLLMAAVCVCLSAPAKESQAGFYFEQTVSPGGNVTNAKVRAAFENSVTNTNQFNLTLSYLSAVVDPTKNFGGEGVLTGFLWSAPIPLTSATAAVTGTNSIVLGTVPTGAGTAAGSSVAPWWAYKSFGTSEGVGAAGGSLFGDGDRIDQTTVTDPEAKLDGTDFGLLAFGSQLPSGTRTNTWVQSNDSATPTSVVFTFTAAPGFDLDAITSGQFLFGSDLNQYDAGPKVPAPSTLLGLFSLTSFGSVLLRRRRRAASLGATEASGHQPQNALTGDGSDKASLALN